MTVGASLILSWENPTDLWNPAARRCQVWRYLNAIPGVLIADDITWGFYHDIENSDPAAVYQVNYVDVNGGVLFGVLDKDIERYARPNNICAIEFCRTDPIGMPDAGREIEISNEAGGSGEWRKNIVTSSQGKAVFYAMPNTRLLMRIEGDMQALDFVVPDQRFINADDLAKFGSLVDFDPRRSIGVNP